MSSEILLTFILTLVSGAVIGGLALLFDLSKIFKRDLQINLRQYIKNNCRDSHWIKSLDLWLMKYYPEFYTSLDVYKYYLMLSGMIIVILLLFFICLP